MKKRKNKKTALILVLILLISVGYAALASNLKINGSSSVKSAAWSVYWDNVVPTTGGNTTVTIPARIKSGTNSTEVEYAVTLNEPGDYYEFTVDAVNNGTIDAMIAANGIVNGVYSDSNYTQTATLPKAVSYTVTYADGKAIADKHLLAKKSGNTATRETYKVRIEYRNDDEIDADDLDENDQTYYFKFSVNYVQADSNAIDRPVELQRYSVTVGFEGESNTITTGIYINDQRIKYIELVNEYTFNYILEDDSEGEFAVSTDAETGDLAFYLQQNQSLPKLQFVDDNDEVYEFPFDGVYENYYRFVYDYYDEAALVKDEVLGMLDLVAS